MIADSGADGALIGRGTYGRPWFPNQVWQYLQTGTKLPNPSLPDQLATVMEHYEHLLEHYGEQAGSRIARKHLGWYSKGLPKSTEFRSLINSLSDVEQVKEEIYRFYNLQIEQIAA
jgi:tRNA-dihydrouridine synthase B